jgi:hypothetical protein
MRFFIVVIAMFNLTLQKAYNEDVLDTIRLGKWDYGTGTEIRFSAKSSSDESTWTLMPLQLFSVVDRKVIVIPANLEKSLEMMKQRMLAPHLRSYMSSIEDVIICNYDDKPDYRSPFELKPIPTLEQEQFLKTLSDKWLIPLPQGFSVTSQGRGIWYVWKPIIRTTAILKAGRGAVKTKSQGGLSETVYWYGRNLSADEAMLASIRLNRTLEPYNAYGHTFLRPRRKGVDEDNQPELFWSSGPFLVHLRMPEDRKQEITKAYLEKYPPTWNGQVRYEPTRLALQVLEQTIPELQKHREGPLEYLRYSFRRYPFDVAFEDAVGVLPPEVSNWLREYNENKINEIQTTWSQTPVDKIKLDDYKQALFAHRQLMIDKIIAARDRIEKHGIAHIGPQEFWSYGDAQDDK